MKRLQLDRPKINMMWLDKCSGFCLDTHSMYPLNYINGVDYRITTPYLINLCNIVNLELDKCSMLLYRKDFSN